jgi:hypothetical protein
MSLPIVIIHVNNSEYLSYSLAQAKKSNPESKIVLLGDSSNDCYKFIEHENIFNYYKNAQNFSDIYRHNSVNSYNYELFCFQRWFFLKDFMAANDINKCLHIDSDVMLYANVTEEQKKFANYDLSLPHGISPHCLFINNLNVLEKFCDFLIEIYTDSSIDEQIKNNSLVSISDMTAFREFGNLIEFRIGNISNIRDNSKYDLNINCSEGFEMKDGRKNIYLLEEQPFCKYLDLPKDVKFNIIHFQGHATKKYMKDYFSGDNILNKNPIVKVQNHKNSLDNPDIEINNYDSSIISKDIKDNYIFLDLPLSDINLIIFPDWCVQEEFLGRELQEVIMAIATHRDRSQMTLLIDCGKISEENAGMLVSSVIMNIFMEEDLDVTQLPQISIVGETGKMNRMEWEALLSCVHFRIVLKNENKQTIANVRAEHIPIYELSSL